jgi:hypothetical protein
MHRGYTKRWRKRWDKGYHLDHLLWIMMDYFIDFANWKENEFPFLWKGKLVDMVKVSRGQCFFTISGLADFLKGPKNKVSRDMIRSRLQILEKIGFLSRSPSRQYQIITVLNYDKYNPMEKEEPHKESHETHMNATSNPHQTHTPNKDKKVKKVNTYTPEFLYFWKIYPKKIGKGAAFNSWRKIGVTKDLAVTIYDSIKSQCKCEQWQKDNGQFIPNPSTWLNQSRWEDEIEPVYKSEKPLTEEEKWLKKIGKKI